MTSRPLLSAEYAYVMSPVTAIAQPLQMVTHKCPENKEGRFGTGPAS